MAKFDITAAFQAAVGAAGNVSKSDTSRETIEYISLDKLEAEACGKGITPDLLRRLYSGDEVVPIQVWRQVGAGLGNLGVSKLDTNGG